ncbi:MAG: formate--tetrahydrofolate ligase, partial [Leptospiraceae bacterium]|nr:formate--tetrahydrofolate ligase [Leptospiraceae bacterium]
MQNLKPITEIAVENGLPVDELELYGKYKAKVPYTLINQDKANNSKLILMTSTTPNKAGAGKTTTSIALAQGLKKLGKKATLALREPSLGPVFGMKGGATGGGLSSVHPSNDINLHFNGDFHAITAANNLIAALVDNYRYYNKKNNPLTKIYWKRALDMNDRSLRSMIAGLEGNGLPTETGFDITAASEIMAIFCLAESLVDLEHRINNIRIGKRADGSAFYFGELESTGAVIALLQQAIHPNLVQTTEGVPAFIHGGPFANIAHGCNSVLATRMAMTYGDYAITEAGFGADLGAEKFMNIKCRAAHLQPAATVIVTNSMSLKLHGGLAEQAMKKPAEQELRLGLKNLERHVENMQSFNQKVIVAYNKFP